MGHAALLVAPLASRTLDWLRAGAAVQKADEVVLPSSEWLPGQRDPGGPFTPPPWRLADASLPLSTVPVSRECCLVGKCSSLLFFETGSHDVHQAVFELTIFLLLSF